MLRKILTASIALASYVTVNAQDSTVSPLKITGSADAYYRYNFSNPKSGETYYNSYTSFTASHNTFQLGMASVKAEYTKGKAGVVIDLGFGQRAEDFAYNDNNTKYAIKQLYVTYSPSDKVKFTFGSWATHIGYEVLDAYLNRNYSMSYMFSFGPFSHTGVKADISLGGKSALMLGIANPTDFRSYSGAPKTFLGQFSTGSNDDKLKAYLNFAGGKQTDSTKVIQGDVVLTYAVSSMFSLGYNGTVQSVGKKEESGSWKSNSWWGSALYLNLDPESWFGLTLRGEYIGDKNVVKVGSVFAATLSANFKVDNLTIIPEFRLDNAKNEIFMKSAGDPTKSTGTFLLAATYHF